MNLTAQEIALFRVVESGKFAGAIGCAIVPAVHPAESASFHWLSADKYVRIDWDHVPTSQDYSDVNATLTGEIAAALKLAETEAWYQAAIAAGFDTGLGFRLRIDDDARNEFDALMTSINSQLIAGTPLVSIAMPLIYGLDDSQPYGLDDGHALTAAEFITAFSAGKIYYAQLLGLRSQYIAAIKAGNTTFTPGDPINGGG